MRIVALHFVCKEHKNWKQLDANWFETGNWKVSDKAANDAIGARIYLHEKQDAIAYEGGTIVEWRPIGLGRKIFTYRLDGDFKVCCPGRWGNEKAIVRR